MLMSMNLHRRHLNESQRALVGAKLANMPSGRRTDLGPPANLPEVSQSAAATLLNVSERSLRTAKTVLHKAAPAVVQAVEQGHMPISGYAWHVRGLLPGAVGYVSPTRLSAYRSC